MRIVASRKEPLDLLVFVGLFLPVIDTHVRVAVAGAEDRATLESDPSADAGEYTDGQGQELCPFFCPSGTR